MLERKYCRRWVVAAVVISGIVSSAKANVFQWQYINPLDPSQGKRQSTTLAPDGAGVDAVPGAYLAERDLEKAYLIGADLTGANAEFANLANADLSQAILTDSYLRGATLIAADLTDVEVRGASFNKLLDVLFGNQLGTGITLAQLYSTASYKTRDLSGIGLGGNSLWSGSFVGQNLTSANFAGALLFDADFTGADVRRASFSQVFYEGCSLATEGCGMYAFGSGITASQLYSTATYQAHDLTRIGLGGNFLPDCNFASQDLTDASFAGATLSGADFTSAEVRGANFSKVWSTRVFFGCGLDECVSRQDVRGSGITPAQLYVTASYQAHDLSGIGFGGSDLTGGSFAGQNLTNANFYRATLIGADFSGAEVLGTNFSGAAITLAQLYSTASYQAHNLAGIGLGGNLTGAHFVGQNLTNAHFISGFCDGSLSFCDGANLTNADLTAADLRGDLLGGGIPMGLVDLSEATTTNLIWPDGHLRGVNLHAGELLVVRDYDGNPQYEPVSPPISITIDDYLAMGHGGTLRMMFEADAWDSTISFAPGISVALGGTLELRFTDDVNLASQLGRKFHVINWFGVTPTGTFVVSSTYIWDLSNLYTTGDITLTAAPEPAAPVLLLLALVHTFYFGRKIR